MVNPEGLLCCVVRSRGRSYNLFSDFHILEDASEHDGLIVTAELSNIVTDTYNVTNFNAVIFNMKKIYYGTI